MRRKRETWWEQPEDEAAQAVDATQTPEEAPADQPKKKHRFKWMDAVSDLLEAAIEIALDLFD